MMYAKPKVSVIGCGNVGMRYAYALIIRGMARELMLVDVDPGKAEAEAMDLSHGAPYFSPVNISAGGYPDVAGSDLVVITAGKKQKPGQTRIDLVRDNVELYRSIIPEIVKFAPDALLLVISNPVDILAYAAYRFSGKPSCQVIGSGTVLDSARFRYQIAAHCHLDPRNVHAYILGEHGDTEFPVWSKAMVGAVMFNEYCLICRRRESCRHAEEMHSLFAEARDAAYRIIEKKGETSYGIGLSAVRITEAILGDQNAVLPVSSFVQDYHGISDVYLSVPVVLNKQGVREVLKIDFSPEEHEAFRRSADTLKNVIRDVGL